MRRRRARARREPKHDRAEEKDDDGESIRVVVRMRPMNQAEVSRGDIRRITSEGNAISVPFKGASVAIYRPNLFLDTDATQEDVFEHSGVKRLLDMCLQGFASTVFAYGPTGTGKTYTTVGTDALMRSETVGGLQATDGIVPRSIRYLFAQSTQQGRRPSLRASCLEIYNDQVADLLAARKTKLHVRWSNRHGFFPSGLVVTPCQQQEQMLQVLATALRNREVAAHSMNARSNRSHMMFTVYVDSESSNRSGAAFSNQAEGFSLSAGANGLGDFEALAAADGGIPRCGKVTFVDLAGSERLKDTGSSGDMIKETGHINKSLSTLGKVIRKMNSPQRYFVPYRDSTLTKLLINSLGGKCSTLMVACISEGGRCNMSSRTLQFAMGVKNVKNKPEVLLDMLDPQERLILQLKKEISKLRNENKSLKIQDIVSAQMTEYASSSDADEAAPESPLGGAASLPHLPPGRRKQQPDAEQKAAAKRAAARSFEDFDHLPLPTLSPSPTRRLLAKNPRKGKRKKKRSKPQKKLAWHGEREHGEYDGEAGYEDSDGGGDPKSPKARALRKKRAAAEAKAKRKAEQLLEAKRAEPRRLWKGGIRLNGSYYDVRVERADQLVTIYAFHPVTGVTLQTELETGPVLVSQLLQNLEVVGEGDAQQLIICPPATQHMFSGVHTISGEELYVTLHRVSEKLVVTAFHPVALWKQTLEIRGGSMVTAVIAHNAKAETPDQVTAVALSVLQRVSLQGGTLAFEQWGSSEGEQQTHIDAVGGASSEERAAGVPAAEDRRLRLIRMEQEAAREREEKLRLEAEAEQRAARREEAEQRASEMALIRQQQADLLQAELQVERERYDELVRHKEDEMRQLRDEEREKEQRRLEVLEIQKIEAAAARERAEREAAALEEEVKAHLRAVEMERLQKEQAAREAQEALDREEARRKAELESARLEAALVNERERKLNAERKRLAVEEEARAAELSRQLEVDREARRLEAERRRELLEREQALQTEAERERHAREKQLADAQAIVAARAGDMVSSLEALGGTTPEAIELERLRRIERERALVELEALRQRQHAREVKAIVHIQRIVRGFVARRRVLRLREEDRTHRSAVAIQSRIRSWAAVRVLARMRFLHAKKFGVMLALPGTVQGFNGFYVRADALQDVFRFNVERLSETDIRWHLADGPMSRDEWMRQAAQLRKEREAAARSLQRVWRGHRGRRSVWELKWAMARSQGVMLALPGTKQGKSGWYRSPATDRVTHFTVTPAGVWRQDTVELDDSQHREVLMVQRGEFIPLQGTKNGMSGWYRVPPGEHITYVVCKKGVKKALFKASSQREWAGLIDRCKRQGAMQACPGTDQGSSGYYVDVAGNICHWEVAVDEEGKQVWTEVFDL